MQESKSAWATGENIIQHNYMNHHKEKHHDDEQLSMPPVSLWPNLRGFYAGLHGCGKDCGFAHLGRVVFISWG